MRVNDIQFDRILLEFMHVEGENTDRYSVSSKSYMKSLVIYSDANDFFRDKDSTKGAPRDIFHELFRIWWWDLIKPLCSLYIYIYIYIYIYVYVYMYVCMYVNMYVCMWICMYVCEYVCMWICMYVYIVCLLSFFWFSI